MRNRMYGGVRGRKTKVGRKLLRFPPTRLFPYLKTKIYYCLVVFAIKCIFAPWKVHIWQVQTRRLCANLFKKL